MSVANFTVLDSVYGKFIVNRHCSFQAEHLIKTGVPHIQAELENILAIVNTLPDECVVVDAGANIGLVAIPIAQQLKQRRGTVHAFEVQRMMYNALCGAVALNDLDRLWVHQAGLGASPGFVTVALPNYASPQDFGLFSLNSPGQLKTDATRQTETVEVKTVDALKLSRLDFFKIDVEGMELDVLDGAKATLHAHQPWCWIEYWKLSIDQIKAKFAGLDYRFYVMDALNLLCAPNVRVSQLSIQINAQSV